MSLHTESIAPGVQLHTLPADKFNRCRLSIHFRFAAARPAATDHALLPLVLERGYSACPDMTALSRKLARLYGADLTVATFMQGACRVLSVSVTGIKDEFALEGEHLSAEYAALAFGVAFEPYFENGAFSAEAVNIEKATLARQLESEINDKRLYCVRQAQRRFFGDSPAGVARDGYLEDLPAVTPASLTAAYKDILRTASIDVMVQGADADNVAERLLQALQAVPRAPRDFAGAMAMPVTEPRHYCEAIPGLTQAKLCMLFTTGTPEDLPSINLLRMAMGVYGGMTTSRLFRNVRERQGLCYYCGATALRATGVMMVDSGVEPGREAQAEAAILQEWRDLCEGPITEEEMQDCRRGLLSSMDALGDSLSGLEGWYYGQIARGEPLSPPEYGRVQVEAVTADAVQELLGRYHYSVCYALTAAEAEKGGDAE